MGLHALPIAANALIAWDYRAYTFCRRQAPQYSPKSELPYPPDRNYLLAYAARKD